MIPSSQFSSCWICHWTFSWVQFLSNKLKLIRFLQWKDYKSILLFALCIMPGVAPLGGLGGGGFSPHTFLLSNHFLFSTKKFLYANKQNQISRWAEKKVYSKHKTIQSLRIFWKLKSSITNKLKITFHRKKEQRRQK